MPGFLLPWLDERAGIRVGRPVQVCQTQKTSCREGRRSGSEGCFEFYRGGFADLSVALPESVDCAGCGTWLVPEAPAPAAGIGSEFVEARVLRLFFIRLTSTRPP